MRSNEENLTTTGDAGHVDSTSATTGSTDNDGAGERVAEMMSEEARAVAKAVQVVIGRTRCRDSMGYVGTIWYDGLVPSQKKKSKKTNAKADSQVEGVVELKRYLGVVWDNPDRGRHNGSLVDPVTGKLVTYFVPPPMDAARQQHSAATCASFVVPSRLDFGRPLTFGLLLERYWRNLEEGWWDDHRVRCSRDDDNKNKKTKAVEFVGADKIVSQQQVEALRTISLRFMGIHSIPSSTALRVPGIVKDVDAGTNWKSADAGDSASELLSKLSTRDGNIDTSKLELCVHVDLAGNLLTEWTDLQNLLAVMPQLRHVSVAHNRFVDATIPTVLVAAASPPWSQNLVQLNLSKCNIRTSRTLIALGRALPRLDSLCCAYADLGDLVVEACLTPSSDGTAIYPSLSQPVFGLVRDLDATGCSLTQELLPSLSALFPSVSRLNLTANPVESWPKSPRPVAACLTTGNDDGVVVFPRLTHLQWTLSRRYDPRQPGAFQMSIMDDVEFLVESHHDRLIGLRLELGGNSHTKNTDTPPPPLPVPCKLLLIACMGKLEVWNGGHIHYQERRDAEIFLLRHSGSDGELLSSSPGVASEGSSVAHRMFRCPRYTELRKTHPDAIRLLGAGGGSASGAGGGTMNLVTVELRSLCPHSCERPPVVRRLPASLTLGKLKAMLGKQFDLDTDLQDLSWIVASPGDEDNDTSQDPHRKQHRPLQMPTALNEPDSATLEQCGLVHGAIVFMSERIISPSEKEEHRLLQKIQQQEEERAWFEQRKRAAAESAI